MSLERSLDDKASGLTLLFNFLLPGAGHLYASSGHEGAALLVANLACGVVSAFIYVTFVINIGFWIYSMATSRKVTEMYNAERASARSNSIQQARKPVIVYERAPAAPSASSALLSCPDCGGKVSRRAPACPHCGSPVKDSCVDCGGMVPSGATTCPGCGCPIAAKG